MLLASPNAKAQLHEEAFYDESRLSHQNFPLHGHA
jgi:hypothetical protein